MQKGTMVAVICTAGFLIIGMIIGVLAYTKRVGNQNSAIVGDGGRSAQTKAPEKKV